jgi:hypothetical protein
VKRFNGGTETKMGGEKNRMKGGKRKEERRVDGREEEETGRHIS